MTAISLLRDDSQADSPRFHAIAGDKHLSGKTVGKAIDTLTPQLSTDEAGTLIIVQNQHPDQFFSAVQQKRLEELMTKWRSARDSGQSISPEEQTKLEQLVKAEVAASGLRAAALLREASR